MRKGLIGAAVAAAVVVAGVLPATPAHAGTGTITTIAGGPGSGPALDLGQNPTEVALTRSSIWLIDETSSFTASGFQLRVIDRATGQESEPLLSMPTTYPTTPHLAPTPDGGVVVSYAELKGGSRIVRVSHSGEVTPLAGGGNLASAMVDGLPGTLEALGEVRGVAVDAAGVVYFSESNVHKVGGSYPTVASRVRKIGTGGRLLPVAGLAPGFAGDGGPALTAKLDGPSGLAVDDAGDLYVADTGNGRVRKITTSSPTPTISTVVATTTTEIAHSNGDLFWLDAAHYSVRDLSAAGTSTVVGDGTLGHASPDGPAAGRPALPLGFAVLGQELVVSEYSGGDHPGHVLERVDLATGLLTRIAGNGHEQLGGDGGPALKAQVDESSPVAVDPAGRVYIGDMWHLRRIDPDGSIRTVAGSEFSYTPTGLGGPATAATFDTIQAIALAPTGHVVFAVGSFNARILDLDPTTGTLALLAGGGTQRDSDGTPVLQATISYVQRLAFDAAGNVLYAALFCTVRRLEPSGVLGTVPGTATCQTTPDGPVTAGSGFVQIRDFDVAPNGDPLVLEEPSYNGPLLLRRLSTTGVITTVAGAGTSTADGVPAAQAGIPHYATGVTVDRQGRALLTDVYAGLIRRIDLDGTISTVVGAGTGADGTARTAAVLEPQHVAVGPLGDLYLSCRDLRTSYHAGVIRKVTF